MDKHYQEFEDIVEMWDMRETSRFLFKVSTSIITVY